MKKSILIHLVSGGMVLGAYAGHWGGSRTVPVHRIPLSDEDGQPVVSSVGGAMPMSARKTCGVCHDYDTIHTGWHFNAGAEGVDDGRPGEPWVKIDAMLGTQLPVSARDWPGVYTPAELGLTPWTFTRAFGMHMPGGGIADPDDKLADMDARWTVSGGLEVNCLGCHNNSPRQDLSEWARQVGRENFRWAATAAAGLGEVGGMASRLPGWWNVHAGPNPDDSVYAVPPSVKYDTTLFDSHHRVWFELGKPQDHACLGCHSVHAVNLTRGEVPGDVHTAVGLTCVQCHNNGLDHAIVRGEPGSAMSCEACHVHDGATPGKSGAPVAHHKGIPPVHFDVLTCTACHSGPVPAASQARVRTSRANRLGIYGRAQWFTEAPFVVEPVFVRNEDGRIEPRRMMWPAFWATEDGETLRPISTDVVEASASGILGADRLVADVLAAMNSAASAPGEAGFVTAGTLYRRNVDGGLDAVGPVVTEVSWIWKTATNIVSTIPEFDVRAEELDQGAEDRILDIMDALAPLAGGRVSTVVRQGRIFQRGEDGYLQAADTRAADGWYWRSGEALDPLVPAFAERAVADTVGTLNALNEEQVSLMLKALGERLQRPAVYVANGRKFSLAADGSLTDADHPAAEPVSWALGHDVRPAATALGARSCKECHAADSDFFFSHVTATGPLKTERSRVKPMNELQNVQGLFGRLFGLTFLVRSYFKMALGAFAAVLFLVLVAVGLPAAARGMIVVNERFGSFARTVWPLLVLLIGVLSVTGFIFGWPVRHPLQGFPLLAHVGAGAFYGTVLCVWALLRAQTQKGIAQSVFFWMLIAAGVLLILSVLVAMFPLLGTHGQHLCLVAHRVAALLTLFAAAGGCVAARKSKRG